MSNIDPSEWTAEKIMSMVAGTPKKMQPFTSVPDTGAVEPWAGEALRSIHLESELRTYRAIVARLVDKLGGTVSLPGDVLTGGDRRLVAARGPDAGDPDAAWVVLSTEPGSPSQQIRIVQPDD